MPLSAADKAEMLALIQQSQQPQQYPPQQPQQYPPQAMWAPQVPGNWLVPGTNQSVAETQATAGLTRAQLVAQLNKVSGWNSSHLMVGGVALIVGAGAGAYIGAKYWGGAKVL